MKAMEGWMKTCGSIMDDEKRKKERLNKK